MRLVVRVAPAAGVCAAAVALAVRITGASPLVTAATVAALAVAVVAAYVVLRGRGAAPDVVAARVDGDAGLGGELRSAHWFASQPGADAWAGYHLSRAATHAGAVDWPRVYPPVQAVRAWAMTGAGVVVALALAMTTPGPAALSAADLAAAEAAEQAMLDTLPPELRAQLEALLRQMAEGGETADVAEATMAELQELMKQLDPELAAQLAEMARNAQEMADAMPAGEKPLDGADMAKDSSAGLAEDVRWAADDLAERLANASRERQTAEKNASASEETGEMASGSEQPTSAEGANSDMQMKMSREAAADPGAARMTMGGAGAMGGDSRPGAGGNSGADGQNALDPLAIAQALRQELVEASADTKGENVEREDIRRKTEQGEATVGYTRVAPPSTVDRSRAQAPPVVPDARRALLHSYFIRHQ